jgi:hypothetical protein
MGNEQVSYMVLEKNSVIVGLEKILNYLQLEEENG